MVKSKIPWPQSDIFSPDIFLPDILEEETDSAEADVSSEEDSVPWLYPF